MRNIFMLILLIAFCLHSTSYADISEEKIIGMTKTIQKIRKDWTVKHTRETLEKAKNTGHYQTMILIDKDRKAHYIEVKGDTVLLNGKDISGNLGSKETHGDYSPIIENYGDSQIAIGDKNTIKKDTKTVFNIENIFKIAIPSAIVIYIISHLLVKKRKNNKQG